MIKAINTKKSFDKNEQTTQQLFLQKNPQNTSK